MQWCCGMGRVLIKSCNHHSCHLQLDCPLFPCLGWQRYVCAAAVVSSLPPWQGELGYQLSLRAYFLGLLLMCAPLSAPSLCAGWPKGSWTSLCRRKRVTGGRGSPSKRSARSSWHPTSTAGWTNRMLKWSWRRRSVLWAPVACAASYKARTAVLLCLNLHSSFTRSCLAGWLLLLFYIELVKWFKLQARIWKLGHFWLELELEVCWLLACTPCPVSWSTEDHVTLWCEAQRIESWALSVWEEGISKAFLSHWAGPAGAFPPSGELEQLTAVGRCKTDLEKTWTDHIPANPFYNKHCPVPLCSHELSTGQRGALQCQEPWAMSSGKGRQRAWAGCSLFPSGRWWVM